MKETPFYKVSSLNELDMQFNGVSKILETFFENYKGQGKMESLGFSDEKEANRILNNAIDEYNKE